MEDLYELSKLGWNSFQQLCLTIAREVLGQTVVSFLDSHGGGRDGAFSGTWKQAGSEDLTGRFVIQCKFTGSRNQTIQIADLSDEVAKVERLVSRDLCDTYILMTNARLSGEKNHEIQKRFRSLFPTHELR